MRVSEYGWALAIVATSTLVCLATRTLFQTVDHAMIFLLGILLCASRFALGPSVVAVVASVAAFDFFFVPPHYTFSVSDGRYVVTFVVMLVVGLTVSRLTVQVRAQAEGARERERRTAALLAMSRELMLAGTQGEVVACATRHLRDFFKAESVVLLTEKDGETTTIGSLASGMGTEEREGAIARWVHEHRKPAGHGTDTLPGTDVLFLPLVGATTSLGVLGIALGRRATRLTPSERQLLETFVTQTAHALERLRLSEEAAAATVTAETERTRNTLLSAVSHDLRTPLATVSGAAEALLESPNQLEADARRDLLETIREEAGRLTRVINDLLDLTRLTSGAITVQKEWHPLEEIVGSALGRVEASLKDHPVRVDLPPRMLLVPVDATLLEQVLINLVENAAKYSSPGAPIEIRAGVENDVLVEVLDRGSGLAPGEEEAIFERFYRSGDARRANGTGLGLAICRAIVRAHGGSISASAREGGGAVFRFTLPRGAEPPAIEASASHSGNAPKS